MDRRPKFQKGDKVRVKLSTGQVLDGEVLIAAIGREWANGEAAPDSLYVAFPLFDPVWVAAGAAEKADGT